MLRRFARGRRSFAPERGAPRSERRGRGRTVAPPAAGTARILSVPLAALLAAAAGLVFVVLLPICGIATLAEDVARGSWRAARSGLRPRREPEGLPGY